MNPDRPKDSGDKRDGLELVRRQSSAVEKIAPGAKRIVTGMVADALAQAKNARHLRIVLVHHESFVTESFAIIIQNSFRHARVLSFNGSSAALEELLRIDPDLLITDDIMPVMAGSELCRRLFAKGIRYPVVVLDSWGGINKQWVQKLAEQGLSISLLPIACDIESILRSVETTLKIQRNGSSADTPSTAVAPRRKKPLRIITLDDEPFVLDATSMIIRFRFDDAIILSFTDAEKALQELEREDPDLFTTDWNHPGRLHGGGLLQVLANRGVKYPIFVMSAYAEYIQGKNLLRNFVAQGLNVSLISKPFTAEQLWQLMSEKL